MAKQKAIVSKIWIQEQADNTKYDHDSLLPVVTLEDFFEGNDDPGSLGCNLLITDFTELGRLYSLLKAVRDKAEVQDIVVEISEVDMDDDIWPFSERIYVLTSAAKSDVARWLKRLSPDKIDEGIPWSTTPSAFPSPLPGVRIYAVTLLTRPSNDFERVPKLKVDDWSA